jgi:hypothetical protein
MIVRSSVILLLPLFGIFNLTASCYSFGSCETVALDGPFFWRKKRTIKRYGSAATPLVSSGFSYVRHLFVINCDTEILNVHLKMSLNFVFCHIFPCIWLYDLPNV